MKKQPEYEIQCAFVRYMALRYPRIVVFSDTAAHIGKTMRQQKRANALQTKGKQPDTFIAQPSGDYAGLWLEFKAETPFKKDGVTLKKNEHIEGQLDTMRALEAAGYACAFVWSRDMAADVVQSYLDGEKIILKAVKTK